MWGFCWRKCKVIWLSIKVSYIMWQISANVFPSAPLSASFPLNFVLLPPFLFSRTALSFHCFTVNIWWATTQILYYPTSASCSNIPLPFSHLSHWLFILGVFSTAVVITLRGITIFLSSFLSYSLSLSVFFSGVKKHWHIFQSQDKWVMKICFIQTKITILY